MANAIVESNLHCSCALTLTAHYNLIKDIVQFENLGLLAMDGMVHNYPNSIAPEHRKW